MGTERRPDNGRNNANIACPSGTGLHPLAFLGAELRVACGLKLARVDVCMVCVACDCIVSRRVRAGDAR